MTALAIAYARSMYIRFTRIVGYVILTIAVAHWMEFGVFVGFMVLIVAEFMCMMEERKNL